VSTILKALQRLEDEKSANVERSLNEQVVAHRPPPDPERRGLRIGAIAVGGLAVVAAVFYFWPAGEETAAEVAMEPVPAAAVPVITAEVAAEKPRRRRSARPAPAARAQQDSSEVEISPVIEVVKRLDAPPGESDSGAPAALTKSAAPLARAGAQRPDRRPNVNKPDPQVARGPAQPIPTPKQVADTKPPATQISGSSVPAKPVPAPPAPIEIAAVAPKSAPAAATAPIPAAIQEPARKIVQRAKLPAVIVEKTIWHPDADRRIAVIKLVDAEETLRLKEGDAVGPLVVKTINPGSVLFGHDEIEIRYNVGG
jgi:hypothetical protein